MAAAAAAAGRWLVSVEGVPVPARTAVLKCLQARCGVACLSHECSPAAMPSEAFACLLDRMKALARVPASQDAAWAGPWAAACVTEDQCLAKLYDDLAEALAEALPPPGKLTDSSHLTLSLQADEHEAFEALMCNGSGAAANISLRCLTTEPREQADRRLFASVQIEHLPCPPFCADNPVELHNLVTSACEAYSRASQRA